MDVSESFRTAWIFEAGWYATDLLPITLARAAARALTVDAVGLSLMGHQQHLPIAASSPPAADAERWQFTVGEGPSFTASGSNRPVLADDGELRRRWPALHDQLHQHTLVRSMVALPLGLGSERIGVVELYAFTPRPASGFDLSAAQVVASSIHTALLGAARTERLETQLHAPPSHNHQVGQSAGAPSWTDRTGTHPAGPAWLNTDPVRRREHVWVAAGMVSALLNTGGLEALTMLRARAYASGQTLDDFASDLITGRVQACELDGS